MHRYRDVENHAGTAKGTVGETPHSRSIWWCWGGDWGRMQNLVARAETIANELVGIIKGYLDREAWLIDCCTGIMGNNQCVATAS